MGCVFVADDYGMSREINEGILDLCRNEVISKISVMPGDQVNLPDTQGMLQIETGLHVTMDSGIVTNGRTIVSPAKLFYLCHIKRTLNIERIVDGMLRQAAFLESKGISISHLDTHQHVHSMPKLLAALIIVAKRKRIDVIRCITLNKRHIPFYFCSLARYGFVMQAPKMLFLYALGLIMKRSLDKHHIRYAENLVLMPLALHGDYAGLLNCFYRRFQDSDAEIVTHPGLLQDAGFDEYVDGRKIEYDALSAYACKRK